MSSSLNMIGYLLASDRPISIPQLKMQAPRCPCAHNMSMEKRNIVAIKLPVKPAAANMVADNLATPLPPNVFDGGSLDRFLASNRAVVPRELSRSRI